MYMQMDYHWISNLDLRIIDKRALLENGMLTDRHMYAVNKLMEKQFPDLQGLHSTLLVQTPGFPPINLSGGYLFEVMLL